MTERRPIDAYRTCDGDAVVLALAPCSSTFLPLWSVAAEVTAKAPPANNAVAATSTPARTSLLRLTTGLAQTAHKPTDEYSFRTPRESLDGTCVTDASPRRARRPDVKGHNS